MQKAVRKPRKQKRLRQKGQRRLEATGPRKRGNLPGQRRRPSLRVAAIRPHRPPSLPKGHNHLHHPLIGDPDTTQGRRPGRLFPGEEVAIIRGLPCAMIPVLLGLATNSTILQLLSYKIANLPEGQTNHHSFSRRLLLAFVSFISATPASLSLTLEGLFELTQHKSF